MVKSKIMKNNETAKDIFNSLIGFGINMPPTALFLIEGILDKRQPYKNIALNGDKTLREEVIINMNRADQGIIDDTPMFDLERSIEEYYNPENL